MTHHLTSADVGLDEVDDLFEGAAWGEDFCDPDFLQFWDVVIGNDAPGEEENIVQLFLPLQIHDAGEEVHVGAGQNRQADGVHVFLEGGVDDLFRRLAQAGVDDFHAGVPEGAGNHLCPPVVTIQTRFGYKHSNLFLSHRMQRRARGI